MADAVETKLIVHLDKLTMADWRLIDKYLRREARLEEVWPMFARALGVTIEQLDQLPMLTAPQIIPAITKAIGEAGREGTSGN